MKSYILLLILSLSVFSIQAQTDKSTYPFKIQNQRIILQYPENGQILQMVFSSVYPATVLSSKAADRLNYEYTIKGDSLPVGHYYLPVYPLKQGTDRFFFATDLSGAGELSGFDGIMGSDLLRSNVVNLDFKNKKISVSKTIEENLAGRKTDTLSMQSGSLFGNQVYYTRGMIEYDRKKEPAYLVLNLIDIPLQAEINGSLYNEAGDQSITLLSPPSFQGKIDRVLVKRKDSSSIPDKTVLLLGLSFLQKFKNVIFDYPHNRVLLVE